MKKFLSVINFINEYIYPPFALIISGFFYTFTAAQFWIYTLIVLILYIFTKIICKIYNRRHSSEPLITFKYEEMVKRHATEVYIGSFLLMLLLIKLIRNYLT